MSLVIRVRTLALLGAGLLALATGLVLAPGASTAQVSAPLPMDEQLALERAELALAAALQAARGEAPEDPEITAFRERVVSAVYRYLDERPRGYRDDCSGFVSAVFTDAGAPMDGVVASTWDLAVVYDTLHWDPRPLPGDLVFFENTWDRNRNGKVDDEYTHIGVVLEVEDDGTILFADNGTSGGRRIARMNVLRPHDARDAHGNVLNQTLRKPGRRDPPGTPTLTGELWIGFAHVDPSKDWLNWTDWVPLK